MKRYGFIYEKICDLDNLKEAHKQARKKKSHYKEVKMVNSNPEFYLKKIQASLQNYTYRVSPYIHCIKIDKGKERDIYKLPYYPDRIIQWAIILQIEHILINNFIKETYASVPKRGIHSCLTDVRNSLKDKEDTIYCLKLDIQKYFETIDHDILKTLLRKKFKDNDLLWLLDLIIDSHDTGLPIGNFVSQYLANLYLSYFDHWVKEQLHCQHYFRYMDDIVILHSDKPKLREIYTQIEQYLNNNLLLTIKQNWQIFPVNARSIDFVGYCIYHDFTRLRKTTKKNMIKKIQLYETYEEINSSIASYKGWLQWGDCHNLYMKYIEPVERSLQLNESSKQ